MFVLVLIRVFYFFFFKQKTAYEMRISDWSSDVCSSDLLLTPPVVALLLVANLVPAIALLVLLGRRIAKRRAAQSVIGGDGQLHVRLVAIFSIIASVPMLFVVIFASLLFQYGVQFWFSDNARSMLPNANGLARGYYEQTKKEVGDETVTMASDLRDYLSQEPVSSPQFADGYIFQVVTRKLNESDRKSTRLNSSH